LLGIARRSALLPFDRTCSDLNEVIETETLAASRVSSLPEPASLHAARRKVGEDAARLRTLEAQADEVLEKLGNSQPRSGWHRLFRPSHDPERQALGARLTKLQAKFLKARSDCAVSGHALKTEEKEFKATNARHQSAWSARCDQGEHRIATARVARMLIDKNPALARWGMAPLMRLAASFRNSRAEADLSDAPDDWDLVPVLDIWGIPILPRPKTP
jgi:hypothetical protein